MAKQNVEWYFSMLQEERLTEINRKHREPEKMFDKYDHFRPINRHREFQPYEERFHYIHPLRQGKPQFIQSNLNISFLK